MHRNPDVKLTGGNGFAELRSGRRAVPGGISMDNHQYQADLSKLLKDIGALPTPEQSEVDHTADEGEGVHESLNQSVGDLKEAVDYLRLAVKYLLFDLEATRRENDYLRQMLAEEPEI